MLLVSKFEYYNRFGDFILEHHHRHTHSPTVSYQKQDFIHNKIQTPLNCWTNLRFISFISYFQVYIVTFLSFKKLSLYIYSRSPHSLHNLLTDSLTYSLLLICPHNALELHLKLFPGFGLVLLFRKCKIYAQFKKKKQEL